MLPGRVPIGVGCGRRLGRMPRQGLGKGNRMNRRDALKLGTGSLSCLAAAGLSAVGARPARADDWPAKNVRVIVPYGAGSATDLIPRTIFEAVSTRLGHSFVVENR